MEKITVYTDGGCSGNPGPGGWACVIIADKTPLQLSGGEKLTTNNRMELTAAIAALSHIKKTPSLSDIPVEVNIDKKLSPLKRRESSDFGKYFEIIWKLLEDKHDCGTQTLSEKT